MSDAQRNLAHGMFLEALAATTVPAAFARHLHGDSTTLRVGQHAYELAAYDEVIVIALGKAAATMFDAFDALLPSTIKRRAIVDAPFPPARANAETQYFSGGHPEPNAASLEAAKAALELLSGAGPNALVVFLISGGASAMFELPLQASIPLPDVIALNRQLVGSGASITEINTVRKHLSHVKGGRLALAAGAREKLTLLVSDVPDGALDALGSGPSLPDNSTVQDCLSVLTRYGLSKKLPATWSAAIREGIPETPKQEDAAFENAQVLTLLDNAAMLNEITRIAKARGFHVVIDNTCDDWDYTDAATYLLHKLHDLQAKHPGKVCLLSGGEVTVKLPESPGTGGRNQQFCLACVTAGISEGVTILSAGTDGIDGNSPSAGAIVDASTSTRAKAAGLSIEQHLAQFDAYPLFSLLGDSIMTGPTGNNLRDLRILLSDR